MDVSGKDVFSKDVLLVLSTSVFQTILNNNFIRMDQLNIVLKLLISFRIPFDLSYSPGTRRLAPGLQLTIHINPTTTLQFAIPLNGGDTLFGGAPIT